MFRPNRHILNQGYMPMAAAAVAIGMTLSGTHRAITRLKIPTKRDGRYSYVNVYHLVKHYLDADLIQIANAISATATDLGIPHAAGG